MSCPVCLEDASSLQWVRLRCGHMYCNPCVMGLNVPTCPECRKPFDKRLVQKTFLPRCDHEGNTEELERLKRENIALKQSNQALLQARDALDAQAQRATEALTKEQTTAEQLRASLSALQSELDSLSSRLSRLASPGVASNTALFPTGPSALEDRGSSASFQQPQSVNQDTSVPTTPASTLRSSISRRPLADRITSRSSNSRASIRQSRPLSTMAATSMIPRPVPEDSIPSSGTTREALAQGQALLLHPVSVAKNPCPGAPVATVTSSGCVGGGAHGSWSYRGTNGHSRKYTCKRCGYLVDERKKYDKDGVQIWYRY
ncbi:hypothetical protein QCA50_004172 [Cerrena zonata]|uniref:RING-type domain-containing protein n=1 Tax=Cerrena zonata TaxID=2478898 RepID=A0AAW0GIQ2_9APHY